MARSWLDMLRPLRDLASFMGFDKEMIFGKDTMLFDNPNVDFHGINNIIEYQMLVMLISRNF